jgi:hypothetical protein
LLEPLLSAARGKTVTRASGRDGVAKPAILLAKSVGACAAAVRPRQQITAGGDSLSTLGRRTTPQSFVTRSQHTEMAAQHDRDTIALSWPKSSRFAGRLLARAGHDGQTWSKEADMNRQVTRIVCSLALAMGFVLLASAPLLAQDVKYNYAMGTNFSKYKTYKWVDIPNQNHPDQITDQQIKTSIETTLTSKGLTKAPGDAADILIAYQIAVNQERQWNAYGGMGGLRFGGTASATSSTINIGTMIVDVFDSTAKQQIWTGEATKTLNPSSNPQKNQQNMQKAVNKLLKNFPPPAN